MATKFRQDSIRDITLRKRGIAPPEDWTNPGQVRAAKKAVVGQDCTAAILAGITVGESRYSLSDRDQQNIIALLTMAQQGASVNYHADGELCRTYSPEEFGAVGLAAMAHVTYHTTLVNHYNRYIDELNDIEELTAVEYRPELQGSDLTPELQANFAAILGGG
jgi:hypothetical protein